MDFMLLNGAFVGGVVGGRRMGFLWSARRVERVAGGGDGHAWYASGLEDLISSFFPGRGLGL